MADGRSVASTDCHETPQNVTIWPFLLAISEKKPHGGGLNQRDEDARDFFCHTHARGPEIKNLDRGCSTGVVLELGTLKQGALTPACSAQKAPVVHFFCPACGGFGIRQTRTQLGLVDLSRIPSGTFCPGGPSWLGNG